MALPLASKVSTDGPRGMPASITNELEVEELPTQVALDGRLARGSVDGGMSATKAINQENRPGSSMKSTFSMTGKTPAAPLGKAGVESIVDRYRRASRMAQAWSPHSHHHHRLHPHWLNRSRCCYTYAYGARSSVVSSPPYLFCPSTTASPARKLPPYLPCFSVREWGRLAAPERRARKREGFRGCRSNKEQEEREVEAGELTNSMKLGSGRIGEQPGVEKIYGMTAPSVPL